MKAIVLNGYGSLDYLSLKDISKPAIKDNEILVKVAAASVNAGDLFKVQGSPFLIRFAVGFPRPKDYVLGWDVAGTVEIVGENVTRFQPGDEVYGSTESTFAEYASGEEILFELIPTGLNFEEAATLPAASLTALQKLRDCGKIRKGQKVLILGASGGVGSMAVQIARSFGNDVDGVCSSRKKDMVISLGATKVYSYDLEDFTESKMKYDLILDNTGRNKFSDMKKILRKNGLIIPNSGHGGMSYVFKSFLRAIFDKQVAPMNITDIKRGDLKVINELFEKGKLRAIIDRSFTLNDTPKAIDYMQNGQVKGKVIIKMND